MRVNVFDHDDVLGKRRLDVLKLATYGHLRLVPPILPDACDHFTPLVQVIAIISLIYSSLATIRQVDFKALVAYSSVTSKRRKKIAGSPHSGFTTVPCRVRPTEAKLR